MPMKENGMVADETERYRHLVAHIQDAVVEFELVDGVPVVRHVNDAFVAVFGYDRSALADEPLNDWIVPDWLAEEAATLDEQTGSGEINYCRVKRETASGLREFLYRGIPYEDETVETDGFAIYTDLDEITRKERRLQVLNRVLRHNLRNDANLILAHTTRLLNEFDEQTETMTETAATLETAAHDLATLCEEVDDVRRVLQDGDDTGAVIDCVPIIEQLANDHRKLSPSAAIETAVPGSMAVRATENLRLAIDQLVDNAIAHNGSSNPRVRISANDADANGWVSICVADDGPLIPASERAVITGDAKISPTRHGRGLGLWLVKWTVDSFGRELAFTESDLGGNSVRLRLPDAEARPG